MTSNKPYFYTAGALFVIAIMLKLVDRDRFPWEIHNYPPKPGPVAVIGDRMLKTTSDSVVKYMQIDRELLDFSEPDLNSQNLLRLVEEVVLQNPAITVVAAGLNDSKADISFRETSANLKKALAALSKAGCLTILVNTPIPVGDNWHLEMTNIARETGTLMSMELPKIWTNPVKKYDQIQVDSATLIQVATVIQETLYQLK